MLKALTPEEEGVILEKRVETLKGLYEKVGHGSGGWDLRHMSKGVRVFMIVFRD